MVNGIFVTFVKSLFEFNFDYRNCRQRTFNILSTNWICSIQILFNEWLFLELKIMTLICLLRYTHTRTHGSCEEN